MKSFAAAVFATLALATAGASAGVVSSGLSSGSYSQSSVWAGQTAQQAFNGNAWNAGGHGTHWIQVDLGAVFDLANLSFVINQQPAGNSWHSVYVDDSSIGANYGSFSAVASRSGPSSAGQVVSLDFSASGRYVTIVANGGPSWTALSNVTVSTQDVPEPASILLAAMGLGLAVVTGRRRMAA